MSLRKPEVGTGFSGEHVFGLRRGLKQFLDSWKSARCSCYAGLNGLAGPIEIVPCEFVNIRTKNQVRVAFPGFQLMFLSGGDGAGNNLEDVLGSTAPAILNANRNGEYAGSAKLASGHCGNLGNEAAIREAARANFNWLEKAWESAAGPNRIHQKALRKDDGIESGEVRGDDSHGNAKIFELTRLENAVH